MYATCRSDWVIISHWTAVLYDYIIYHANRDLELQFFDYLSNMPTGNVIDWNATRISFALQYGIISSGLDSWHTWHENTAWIWVSP